MSAASDNLRTNQEQADIDGCMVKVSRQAVEETLEQFDAMLAALKLVQQTTYSMHAVAVTAIDAAIAKATGGAS